jgi:hypothetical protein
MRLFVSLPDSEELEQTVSNKTNQRVYRKKDGNEYPSVTSVLSLYEEGKLDGWIEAVGVEEAERIKRRAGLRGTAVHELYEKHILGETVKPSMFDVEMFNKVKPELDNIDIVVCLEKRLYSDKYRIAGTVDCIGVYDGELCIIDFKSSLNEKHESMIQSYFIQCTMYSLMFEEMYGIKISKYLIIMGNDVGTCQIFKGEIVEEFIKEVSKLRIKYHKRFGI